MFQKQHTNTPCLLHQYLCWIRFIVTVHGFWEHTDGIGEYYKESFKVIEMIKLTMTKLKKNTVLKKNILKMDYDERDKYRENYSHD